MQRQRESSVFVIRINTCNRAPTAPESFACMDLLDIDRCAKFRDSVLRVSTSPAGRVARPPETRPAATRSARIKSLMTKDLYSISQLTKELLR